MCKLMKSKVSSRFPVSVFTVVKRDLETSERFLVRSHMDGLKSLERAIKQTAEAMPPCLKTITAAAMTAAYESCYTTASNAKKKNLLAYIRT